jgi:5-methyltetrahydropteroyltriglutamate--homocysteine methyltransferase
VAQRLRNTYWQLNQAGARCCWPPISRRWKKTSAWPAACPWPACTWTACAPHELTSIADWLPVHKVLSVGIVDGRNIWRTDLDAALAAATAAGQTPGQAVAVAVLLAAARAVHAGGRSALDPEVRPGWPLPRKTGELAVLKRALQGAADGRAGRSRRHRQPRPQPARAPARIARPSAALPADADQRRSPFAQRQPQQRARCSCRPSRPPPSAPSRKRRPSAPPAPASSAANSSRRLRKDARRNRRRRAQQEALGLDVLVHGEAERNDMVEYFGEQLDGFVFSSLGWVQSYGSRCVKPPIIFGDVSRPKAMTVDWTVHAQSLTDKPMKGMLTGPVTILQWSFVRDDQPRRDRAAAGAGHPRRGGRPGAGRHRHHPDRRAGRARRLAAAPQPLGRLPGLGHRAFRAASAVADATQIHTHMCYAEFNDILPQIAAMDADVITIETSRSDMELLNGFAVPLPERDRPRRVRHPLAARAGPARWCACCKSQPVIPPAHLWVNPDCGLKTRGWAETESALRNMVAAARCASCAHLAVPGAAGRRPARAWAPARAGPSRGIFTVECWCARGIT